MTVANTNPIQHYTANGSSRVFTFDFEVEGKANLAVSVNGATVDPSEYSYIEATRSIEFNTAPTQGSEITVERRTALVRTINYQTHNNSFRPDIVNFDFDRIWRVLQEKGIESAKTLSGLINILEQLSDTDRKIVEALIEQTRTSISEDKDNVELIIAEAKQRKEQDKLYNVLQQIQNGTLGNEIKNYFNTVIANQDPDFRVWEGFGTDVVFEEESGLTQKQKNSQIKTALDYRADDTGQRDSTVALQTLFDTNGKHVIHLTKGTYLTTGVTIPPNTMVYANGAVFKRKVHTGKPVITVSQNSVLMNAYVDGNKNALGSGALGDRGIDLRKDAQAIFCYSYNNARHGFYAVNEDLMDLANPSANQKMMFCKSYDNGFDPGGGGTGDGFSAMNSNNVLFFGCEAWNNARTGFVATTYDRNTQTTDPSYSSRVQTQHCEAWGNGYSDFNFEAVSKPEISFIEGESITFSKSDNVSLHNISEIGSIYAEQADYANISGVNIKNKVRSHSLLYLQGKSPKVSNITATVADEVTTFTSNTIEIVDTETNFGDVSNISVNKAYNGIIVRVANASNLRVDNATNIKYRIIRAEGSSQPNYFKTLTNGKLEIYSSAVPTAGTWKEGDIVFNNFFGGSNLIYAWICTKTGVYGSATEPTWKAINVMQKAATVSNATGTDDTATKLNALIATLKTSGILA